MTPERLLHRLDAIGRSLAETGQGVALIGLGSVGQERERLDANSDLDFFAIVRPGRKADFLDDTTWLSRPCPIAYCFRNTENGFKILYEDGIFAEMAVFEEAELASIPFTAGRIVWKAGGVAEAIARPPQSPPDRPERTLEWLLGEALTCLLVGLQRFQRGEKLSAQRLIQQHAVDRLIELAARENGPAPAGDPFAPERRFEQRFPAAAGEFPRFIQGYERSRESARAILDYLDRRYELNSPLRRRILALCAAD